MLDEKFHKPGHNRSRLFSIIWQYLLIILRRLRPLYDKRFHETARSTRQVLHPGSASSPARVSRRRTGPARGRHPGRSTPFNEINPSFSPDGRWLAYQSKESGKNEVYVRAFPPPSSGQSGKWQISNNGGTIPRWSRTGHDLLYQSGDQIMAASYTVKDDTFVAEKPRVWIAKLGAAAGNGM